MLAARASLVRWWPCRCCQPPRAGRGPCTVRGGTWVSAAGSEENSVW